MTNNNLISVIITTYNWPPALELVLRSYQLQSDKNFELVIADDGSDDKTKSIINQLKKTSRISIKHVWHEDKGFRASKIRNQAVLKAEGDYFIFSDGDCLALPHFVKRHRYYQEKKCFTAGNRILLNQKFTQFVLQNSFPITQETFIYFLTEKFKGHINRFLPFLPSFLNILLQKNKKWQGAKTCNLAVWRDDFFTVNGFDERFEGWGYEDSDLIIRLLKFGCSRKSAKFGLPVLHLWHLENNRNQTEENFATLVETEKKSSYKAAVGLEVLVT